MVTDSAPLPHAPAGRLPSVGQLVARRLSLRILAASVFIIAVIALCVGTISSLGEISDLRRDAHALSSQLAASMEFFDYAPIVNILNAFTKERDSLGGVVTDANGQIVASNVQDPADATASTAQRRGEEGRLRWSFQGMRPNAWIDTRILAADGRLLGGLMVAANLTPVLRDVGASVACSALLATLVLLWIARAARLEVAKALVPIGALSAAFHEMESVRQLSALNVVPEAKEVHDLVDAYKKMSGTLRRTADIEVEHERALAVARTTQMLAHDVRKPFSILAMGLQSISMAKEASAVREVVDRLLPEVDRALKSVNGLITDVMEIGSTSAQVLCEAVSPEALIEASLADIFRLLPRPNVAISYRLQHKQMVHVDTQKVIRVFLNILGNALQASAPHPTQLWFHTREVPGAGVDFVEFCLGNDHSYIEPEDQVKLFDAFYTKGKRGGTGLGLAIAQKVIQVHGGGISCRSSRDEAAPDGRVEFVFTLPVAKGQASKSSTYLPATSAEVIDQAALQWHLNEQDLGLSHHRSERELEAVIVSTGRQLGRPLRVLVVDDEAVYRNALAAFLAPTGEHQQALEVHLAEGSGQALALFAAAPCDLVITDLDLGAESLDGFEMVRALRALQAGGAQPPLICIHSNRIVAADHRTAIDSGADAFLPKPMARAQLLRLVLQAAQSLPGGASLEPHAAPAAAMLEIALLEDNVFMLEEWETQLGQHSIVHAMLSPEAFKQLMQKDPGLIGRLSCVVTDYYFDNSELTGADIGRLVKELRPDLPVILVTDSDLKLAELGGSVDRILPKSELSLAQLAV